MELKNKNKVFVLSSFILIGIFFIGGISFALWSLVLKQTGENIVNTSCFKVNFSDTNPIELEKSYPITDIDGMKLTPYEFTITNTCDAYASYQINLEILDTTTLTDLSIMKLNLNDDVNLLTSKESVNKTLSNASSAYKLQTGYLNANESKTFTLRLWMDVSTPPKDEYMNKVFKSKITVVTSYLNEADTELPIANFTTTKNETGIVVDASTSTDNRGISTYYYSTDGVNYVSSKESNYTFNDKAIEYGIATNTITKLYENLTIKEIYVQVEDDMGNKSEVKKQSIEELAYDETVDNNLRYIGANPNNYVSFNNELWRIIGVMNNIEDGSGNKETRVKLIRNESIGGYSFDNKSTGGSGDWTKSPLMEMLNNGAYWGRTNGTCPYVTKEGSNGETMDCDFSLTGLTENAKNLINSAEWNLGGSSTTDDVTTAMFYERERNTNISGRTTIWNGYIGLMYASDYGFATNGGTTSRETCLNTVLYAWGDSSVSDCKINDWLYKSDFEHILTTDSEVGFVFAIYSSGQINGSEYLNHDKVYPNVFLKSNVKITSGDGSETNPFNLSLE